MSKWAIFFTNMKCNQSIGIMVRMFTNGPGNLASILDRVIPKTQKMVLDAPFLSTLEMKVWIKGKWNNTEKGLAPFLRPWCSRYWKRRLQVTLDYGQSTYLRTHTYTFRQLKKTVFYSKYIHHHQDNGIVSLLQSIPISQCSW